MEFSEHQMSAVNRLKNGSVLCGNVGSGKSRTALMYYFTKIGNGSVVINGVGEYIKMATPRKLYIITPAKKRDDKEWELELTHFLLSVEKDDIVIDSWHNIQKYQNVVGAFFIFDEQHVTGGGKWSKAFIKISRRNKWILLSATPGDKWEDYTSLFIANGFVQNKTQFEAKYCTFDPYVKYKKINGYLREKELERMRDSILIIMKDNRKTIRHHLHRICEYNKEKYRIIWRQRWNIYDNEPIEEISKAVSLVRRLCNSDPSRFKILDDEFNKFDRIIIFYNFDYELELLQKYLQNRNIKFSEWNGHKHEAIRTGNRWAYLVQYVSGGEAWNCVTTNHIVFFSQTYSYRQMEQACGRIDRMNTTYTDLYFTHLRCQSPIDRGIFMALNRKEDFNERAFCSK